jgi:general secretion pathway protein A
MVLRHFKLREQPFSVTPDPRYIYASATHREALSSILYGIQAGLGFISLTGLPGTGKTTILFEAMRRLSETNKIAFLFQTISTPVELLRALLIEVGVKNTQGGLAEMQARLNEVLVSQFEMGKPLVVAIDEAQNLNYSVLEAVRMLSNFETASHKLVQIILTGQPQLAAKLAEPKLLQLRQRISIFGTLRPLTAKEIKYYIYYRLRVAGYSSNEPLFTESASELIAYYSEGMPRNINNICFNALSLGCALERRRIDSDVIREVVADLGMVRHNAPVKCQNVVFYEKPNPVETAIAPAKPKHSKLRSFSKIAAWVVPLSLLLSSPQGRPTSVAHGVASPKSGENHSPPVSRPRTRESTSLSVLSPQIREVEVHKGESLSEICTRHFGEYRPAILREIVRINSSIHDPNHIEAGQRIFVPIRIPASIKSRARSTLAALVAPGDRGQ